MLVAHVLETHSPHAQSERAKQALHQYSVRALFARKCSRLHCGLDFAAFPGKRVVADGEDG